MINKHFLLIGSQGSGTAMMRGLLNAHSKMEVLAEWIGPGESHAYLQWDNWIKASKEAEKKGLIWGNKAVFQPILSHARGKSIARSLIQYIPRFKIIWIFRRIGQLKPIPPLPSIVSDERKQWHIRHPRSFEDQERALSEYWLVKDAYPHRVIMVSFEDVIFRPEAELKRICAFLEVEYEEGMFDGLKDTGNPCWDYGEILLEKL